MRDVMSRWLAFIAVAAGARAAADPAAPAPGAAPAAVVIAKCGDSAIDVTAGMEGASGTLHGVVVSGGNRWSFTASVGLARIGGRSRTVTVESLRTQERKPPRAKEVPPAGLFVDLLLDDRRLLLRHASEGGGDPAYALDLDRCSFPADGDAALAALVPPPTEPVGCAPDAIAGYRTQVARAEKLSDADTEREALALCEDHQKTIEARDRLEQAISDRAARDRIAARGAALLRTEDVRVKTWNKVDACLSTDPADAHSVPALHNIESKVRACYARIAVRP
jgi:hypothetical protein